MNKHILFIHSSGPQGIGEGSTGLVKYLRNSLEDYTFHSPSMPTPENPQYENWKAVLKEEISYLPNETVLVGHSLGGSVLLKYFLEEEMKGKYKALIAVAAPFWGLEDNWGKEDFIITKNQASWNTELPPIVLFHSKEDRIVPVSHMERYAEVLPGVTVKKLSGEDHLYQRGSEELLETIQKHF